MNDIVSILYLRKPITNDLTDKYYRILLDRFINNLKYIQYDICINKNNNHQFYELFKEQCDPQHQKLLAISDKFD